MIKKQILGLLLLAPIAVQAQLTKDATYKVESAVSITDGETTPLWLNANRQGLSSLEKNNGYLRTALFRPLEKGDNFTYAYGLDFVGTVNFYSKVILQQAYLDLSYKKMLLSIGTKERVGEMVNNELSSGSLTYSGNARPIPQLRFELPDYIAIPGTNNWLAIKGHIAYGKFFDNSWQKDFVNSKGRYVVDALYHTKGGYIKIGDKPNFPLTFEGGLEMSTQFGGIAHYYDAKEQTRRQFAMPTNARSYAKAFIPRSGGEDTPLSDQLNVEGNVVGNWNASLTYRFKNKLEIKGYFQHYFEDHSMLFMEYPWKDGLFGLQISLPKNRLVDAVVYEYITSKDQAGPVYWDHTPELDIQISARDNYYNHSFYNAWQHAGQAIGNPLFTSPQYNKNGSINFQSNRLQAHHIGVSGSPTSELHYRFLLSYSSNWGTYDRPFNDVKYNTSGLLEITASPKRMAGWNFTASLAFDKGGMIGNNKGVMIKVCKIGLLK